MKTTKNNIKKFFKILKKVVKLRSLVLIVVLLASNTFAWFIYNKTVEGGVQTHVKAWKVTFVTEDEVIEDEVNIEIPDIYPGMDTFTSSVSATNESEVEAIITFTLLKARILDEEYVTTEGATFYEIASTGESSAELLRKLQQDYPFSIQMGVDAEVLDAYNGTANLNITASWPYESGDDELDTYYGSKAADFAHTNPGEASIKLDLLVRIYQQTTTQ